MVEERAGRSEDPRLVVLGAQSVHAAVNVPAGTTGGPADWVVERTYGILVLHRRLVRDYESRPTSSESLPPIGIYTIPEISFVGPTEERLTEDRVPFEVGVSRYRELERGQIIGDSHGMLKLLVSPEDRTLLGAHRFGTGATELIHIGQTVMGCGGTADHLVDAVFNCPTFAESYKVAILDATNKLRRIDRLRD